MRLLAIYFALGVIGGVLRLLRTDKAVAASLKRYADDGGAVISYRIEAVTELVIGAWFFLTVWK